MVESHTIGMGVLMVLLPLVGGCLSASEERSSQAGVPVTTGQPVAHPFRDVKAIVHLSDGRVVDAARYPGELPVLTQRYVANRHTWEPTVGITRTGAAFYTSIDWDSFYGYGTNVPGRTELYRSQDKGLTWKLVNPNLMGVDTEPFSFDQYLYADPLTGRVFFIHTYLACMFLYWTDDDGETWFHNPLACGNQQLHDHEIIFSGRPTTLPTVGYPNVVYVCANGFVIPWLGCSPSLNGGLTFLPSVPAHVIPQGENRFVPTAGCSGNPHGHGAASFAADGTVYLPHGYCGQSLLHISRNNGLTWEQRVVDDKLGISPYYLDLHEGTVAVDAAGNAYYYWIAKDAMPYLSVSRNQGRTWSQPVMVAVPGVTGTRFPALVAGDEGRIAVLYMGTTFPNSERATWEELKDAWWDAYVGFSLNAHEPEPVFATTLANPVDDPLWIGGCGEVKPQVETDECPPQDFLDIQMNPVTGEVWVTLVDGCLGSVCELKPGGYFRLGRGAVGVQIAGTTLRESISAE